MRIEDWNETCAGEVGARHYEAPWDFYDLASDQRLYRRLGFEEVARETRRFEPVGEHEFIRMERTA